MFASGRWALMIFRKFGSIPLGVTELPHGGLPNSELYGGQAAIYRASKHRDLAVLWLAYYASSEYNMQIVHDADALPPIPKYSELEEFKNPPDYPNEWGCHEVYAKSARTIGIMRSLSPFVLQETVRRYEERARDEVMNDRATPEEAVARAEQQINDEIDRTVAESSGLEDLYNEYVAIQKKIEQYRADDRPVPRDWIKNPFHLRWYEVNGWFEKEGGTP